MKLGVGLPVSGSWATPANVRLIAEQAELLGYDSLWTFQRLLATQGIAEPYRSVLDPVVALAFAAASTRRIRLGVAVLNMPFVSPVVVAKQLATLDVLSDGRVDAGLGLGWSAEEFAATGADPAERAARAVEFVEVVRALWTQPTVTHAGRFYTVGPASFEPKPVQAHLPILLGGTAPAALRRAGRVADGWVSSSRAEFTSLGESVAIVKSAAQRAGRDPGALRFVCRGAVRVRPGGRADRQRLTGSLDEIHTDVHELARLGITEFFFDLNFDPHIGSPDADAPAGVAVATELLEAFAPARCSS